MLVEREQRLTAAMLHGSREAMARAVSTMFLGFRNVRMADEEAAKTVALYVSCVDRLPGWAVDQGCRAAVERNTPFPPSAGEFKALCEAVCEPVRTERGRINSILQADVYRLPDANERARVSAGFNELKRTLGLDLEFGKAAE